MFVIETARSEDRPAVLAVTLAAYAQYENDLSPDAWSRYRDNIERAIYDTASTTILVARDRDEIKGSVLLCEHTTGLGGNTSPEMRLLAVPPENRNQGIAGALIDECERRAASRGMLTLHTTRLMNTARAMYERRGYVPFPQIDFQPTPGFVIWGYMKILDNRLYKPSNLKEA